MGRYFPTWQDSFWTPAHGPGVVVGIDWDGRSVKVEYYDKHRTTYTFDELDYARKELRNGPMIAPDR